MPRQPHHMIQSLIERNPEIDVETLIDALARNKDGEDVGSMAHQLIEEVVGVLYPIAKKVIAGEDLTETEQALWKGEPWSDREQALVDEYSRQLRQLHLRKRK